ncbi:MAG: SagB/ThcOx family dehydrogenase [Nitrososphaerota archaeon]|nr:SagB/ThcOx family dehydrogenase [Candidatus Bathyarchaeota archaeon]MDW8048219.1 SagB/ThcOx family dehydrogenase [Nitrososphaerota archaeon]
MIRTRKGTMMMLALILGAATASLLLWHSFGPKADGSFPSTDAKEIALPSPRYVSNVSVEEALLRRRSIRDYKAEPLTLHEVSQLLWAAQGITDERGLRTAPSAGALYPLEVYLVVGNVEGLDKGVYKYKPEGHRIIKVLDGDKREELSAAALGQAPVKNGAIDIVIAAVYERTTVKYGDRGIRYVHMEAGHAAQNIYLQSTALSLGTVTVGAFYDDQVKSVLRLPENEQPLYILPVGKI